MHSREMYFSYKVSLEKGLMLKVTKGVESLVYSLDLSGLQNISNRHLIISVVKASLISFCLNKYQNLNSSICPSGLTNGQRWQLEYNVTFI